MLLFFVSELFEEGHSGLKKPQQGKKEECGRLGERYQMKFIDLRF